MERITLANGYQLPQICFGTDIVMYRTTFIGNIKLLLKSFYHRQFKRYLKERRIIACSRKALKVGCNFFDTSRAYEGSERMLQDALKGEERQNYYICTKLNNYSQLHDIPAREVLEESMKQLGVKYIDLYLLHWPVAGKYLDYWKQLEELYKEGLCKAIGVSNCKIHHLEEIKKVAEIIPMVNEVELHPLLSEIDLRNYCRENSIQIMAYSSTARRDFRLKASSRMEEVCKETGKNLNQVILRWHIQNGIIPIFNTSTYSHLRENLDVFDFELTEAQMEMINSVNINARTRYDSDNCEWDRL